MTTQLSLFDTLHPPPERRAVDPHGPVVQGPPDVALRLPHPKRAWDLAAIQLHEHEDGTWMWAVQRATGGYKVGPKWGNFAPTQAAAMHHAARELIDWCDSLRDTSGASITPAQLLQIRQWAEALL